MWSAWQFPPDTTACVDVRWLGPKYVYLLGLYLGDGMITQAPRRVFRLRIVLDQKYPGIIDRCAEAMKDVSGLPGREGPKGRVLRAVRQLEALGLRIPAARAWPQAQAVDCPRSMAARARSRLARPVRRRPHRLRWVPRHEPGPALGSRIRLSALLVLEHLARDSSDVWAGLRPRWASAGDRPTASTSPWRAARASRFLDRHVGPKA